MFLLDTNIVSELVKRTPNPKVRDRLDSENPADLRLSSITIFELRFGAARSERPAVLWSRIQRDIISRFPALPFTEEDALAAADLMAPLTGIGQSVTLQDIWLAGVAFNRNLTFVTRNTRHFERIVGLKLENWFE